MADTIETRISMPSVELNKGIRKTFFETLFVTGNVKAHRIDVPLLRNGQPVSIPNGAKVEGYLTRYADDVTVRNPGTASGNVVSVTLEKGCYAKTGAFALTIQVTVDGVTNTVFWGESSIFSSAADTVIDGDYIIYDLAELLKRIDAMKEATEAAETATTNANNATKTADTAATNADNATKAANTATTNANNATEATKKATTNADNATKAANTAAEKINNMTVQVSGLDAGTAPTANLELVDGHYNLSFAIPKGDKGNTGATGATPRITVKVVTGEPGTDASVTQGGSAEAPIITLTIPRGDAGSLGNLTINGKAPDSAGKVELTAADVGALSGTDATLTQAEKAADAKATGDALNQLKGEIEKKYSTEVLWENASPNSSFDEQTVTFDWKAYNYCMIYFLAYVDAGLRSFSGVAKKGDRLRFYFLTDTTRGAGGQFRDFYSDASRFGKAVRLTDSTSDDQRACIPIRIYGVKGV